VKLLALDPHHQLHRQQLIDLIWPDFDPEAGAANLHKVIHLARRALEPALKNAANSRYIATSAQQVQLRSPAGLWIDVEEFERLAAHALRSGTSSDYEAALALYRGDLLTEDLYAEWCAARRQGLRALREQLLMGLGRLYAAGRQHELAIRQFETLIAAAPANEEAHRELMALYALTGRRSEALRQFYRCRDAVRADLDAEPDEATLQLYRRIVSREVGAQPQPHAGPARGHPIDTLAVLPFENDTADPQLEYLAPGLVDSLIKNLSQVPGVRVLAYSTVARYRRRRLNPRRLGRALDVRAVVTGRISRLKNTIVISTELVHTADGVQIWGEEYRLRQGDALAIQERISREIAEKLRMRMTVDQRRRIVKRYTTDPEAYRAYLKGRFCWNKRTADGLARGIAYFDEAIGRDPSYALAYSGLADCYNLLSLYSALPPHETMPKARAAARRALELDPSLAEAHTSLAYTHLYYDWDWAAAERAFRSALTINPNYATAHHWYHEFLTAMGRVDEQMAEILLAQELDPLSLIINTDVGWGLYYGRAYDQAVDQLRRTLELDDTFAVAHLILGLVYAQQRRLDEAAAAVQRAIDLTADAPSTFALAALGYIHALAGRSTDAWSVSERLERFPRARYAADYCRAVILAGLHDHDAACERLDAAVGERYDRLIYLNVEPMFDGLRDHPRFRSVAAAVGLPPVPREGFGKTPPLAFPTDASPPGSRRRDARARDGRVRSGAA